MIHDLTISDIREALPVHLKGAASQSLADKVNSVTTDPEIAEHVRNNFINHSIVLSKGRFKIEDYVSTVAYVTFKLMGHDNRESYRLTFPQRFAALLNRGATEKTISTCVSAYNRTRLVSLVLDQSLIQTCILNQETYQQAINVLADMMENAQSEKVRSDAANSLLTHLKVPNARKSELASPRGTRRR